MVIDQNRKRNVINRRTIFYKLALSSEEFSKSESTYG